MARVNISLTQKFRYAIDSRMKEQLAGFASHSACAGIRNNPEAAKKARVNHHGAFSTKVPARRFITAATTNLAGANFGSELRTAIKEALGTPTARNRAEVVTAVVEESGLHGVGPTVYEETRDTRGNVFGRGEGGKQRGPQRILMKIAQSIAENQKRAIEERIFEDGPDNGNNPEHNADSVIKRKGFDKPLVKNGNMYKSIKGWVE